jgi:uracil phosphoribosyltransferase
MSVGLPNETIEDEAKHVIKFLRRRGFTANDMNQIVQRTAQMILEQAASESKKETKASETKNNLFSEA